MLRLMEVATAPVRRLALAAVLATLVLVGAADPVADVAEATEARAERASHLETDFAVTRVALDDGLDRLLDRLLDNSTGDGFNLRNLRSASARIVVAPLCAACNLCGPVGSLDDAISRAVLGSMEVRCRTGPLPDRSRVLAGLPVLRLGIDTAAPRSLRWSELDKHLIERKK